MFGLFKKKTTMRAPIVVAPWVPPAKYDGIVAEQGDAEISGGVALYPIVLEYNDIFYETEREIFGKYTECGIWAYCAYRSDSVELADLINAKIQKLYREKYYKILWEVYEADYEYHVEQNTNNGYPVVEKEKRIYDENGEEISYDS